MADNSMNGNLKSRRLLAPHPWPVTPDVGCEPGGDLSRPLFYLSWPGWELYLRRRLALTPAPGGPEPLLLPDLVSPEHDFAAIDQLVQKAAQLGAGLLNLERGQPANLPALVEAIAHYSASPKAPEAGPILDDRSYLALWAVNEYQSRQSRSLLAEAEGRERAMWAALKGEEASPEDGPAPPSAVFPGEASMAEEADPRTAYAWRCWRRLAAPLLGPDDLILPTAPPAE